MLKLYDELPFVKLMGLNGDRLTSQRETSVTEKMRQCTGKVIDAAGEQHTLAYSFEARGGDNFYIRIQLQ